MSLLLVPSFESLMDRSLRDCTVIGLSDDGGYSRVDIRCRRRKEPSAGLEHRQATTSYP